MRRWPSAAEAAVFAFAGVFANKAADFIASQGMGLRLSAEFQHPQIQVDPSRPNRVWLSGGGVSYDKLVYVEVMQ